MKKRIIPKIVSFILLGVLVWLLIELIWDWEGSINSFKEGYNAVRGIETEVSK